MWFWGAGEGGDFSRLGVGDLEGGEGAAMIMRAHILAPLVGEHARAARTVQAGR